MYAIDNFIIKWMQAVYNFIWNYFGITKGLIVATNFILLAVSNYTSEGPIWLIMVSLLVCFLFSMNALKEHSMQKKGAFEVINNRALFRRSNLLHIAFRVFMVFNIIIGLYRGVHIYQYLIFIWFYLDTCLVQDRELPETKTQLNYGV